jgi:hypothetical protein
VCCCWAVVGWALFEIEWTYVSSPNNPHLRNAWDNADVCRYPFPKKQFQE